MDETYVSYIVDNKEITTLLRLYLSFEIGMENLLLGVIHNISSYEIPVSTQIGEADVLVLDGAGEAVAADSESSKTKIELPIFFKSMLEDLLTPEGSVFRTACEENRIVCICQS